MSVKDWAPEIHKLPRDEAKEFVVEHHYAGGIHNGPMAWGAFTPDRGELRAVCAFATPCSENVRASVFGREHVDRVTELHRLAVIRPHPTNFTSWFVTRCLKALQAYRPQIRGVLSYADTTEGHEGTIYQALNFWYTGTSGSSSTFYRDAEGRLRHPRQNGVNISRKVAKERGWTPEKRQEKLRYLKILYPSKRERRIWEDRCILGNFDYDEIPQQEK